MPAIRHTTQQLPAVEAAFFCNVFGLAPLLLRHGPGLFYTQRLGLHVLRAVLNVFSMLTFFVGLSLTPIARATALSFTAPLFTALLGALMLGEAFRWRCEATLRRTDRAGVDCPLARARGGWGARARTGSPLAPGAADANPP
jgi:hypothetical protein